MSGMSPIARNVTHAVPARAAQAMESEERLADLLADDEARRLWARADELLRFCERSFRRGSFTITRVVTLDARMNHVQRLVVKLENEADKLYLLLAFSRELAQSDLVKVV